MISLAAMLDEDEQCEAWANREAVALIERESFEQACKALGIPLLGVIPRRDPLSAMCSHKDAHASAWVEPVSTAKPALAGLSRIAPLGRWSAHAGTA